MDKPLDVPKVGEPGPLGLGTSDLIGDTLALAGWTNVIEVALDVTLDYSIDGSDGVEERLAMALSGVLGRTAQAELEPKLGPDGWAALLDEARAELRAVHRRRQRPLPGPHLAGHGDQPLTSTWSDLMDIRSELDPPFSQPGATATEWPAVREILESAATCWLTTCAPTGVPT